jgi:hypothetical protein
MVRTYRIEITADVVVREATEESRRRKPARSRRRAGWAGPSNVVEGLEWAMAGCPDYDKWLRIKWGRHKTKRG